MRFWHFKCYILKLNIFFLFTQEIYSNSFWKYTILTEICRSYLIKAIICYISNRLERWVTFCCCTIIVMLCETHILEPQNVGLYTLRGGGRRSEKVYCLYTHENVDIFGWPLSISLHHVDLAFSLFLLLFSFLEGGGCRGRGPEPPCRAGMVLIIWNNLNLSVNIE